MRQTAIRVTFAVLLSASPAIAQGFQYGAERADSRGRTHGRASVRRPAAGGGRGDIRSLRLVGLFLGKLLDYWLHTRWLYLIGLLLGAVLGFTQMIRMALHSSRND